jgi:hypothetical protein
MLPSILEDAMNTHSGDDIQSKGIEMLVFQLNPLSIDNDLVRGNQLSQFANFTGRQAEAICGWLRLASSWNDLARYRDWVDAALNYWCSRVSRFESVTE